MQVGVQLPQLGVAATRDLVLRHARAAEAAGFDALCVNDHVVFPREWSSPYPYSPDGVVPARTTVDHSILEPLTELAFVAGVTSTIQLGTAVLVLVFVSPHYYYPQDHRWAFGGALEELMHDVGMFDRTAPLSQEGFDGSGADWHEPLRAHIEREDVVVCSPHKVYGPESNDLTLQLRKRGIDKIILAGMSANLCLESHMRELIEQGFEVEVVQNATAAAVLPGVDVYGAAVINFRMIASAVPTTDEVVAVLAAIASTRAPKASASA